MDTLVTLLLPLIVITYIVIDAMTVRKQRNNKKLEKKLKTESFHSLKTIDPILDLTEGNTGKRKNEIEYIKIGEQILNNPSFFDLNRDAINAIYNEEE